MPKFHGMAAAEDELASTAAGSLRKKDSEKGGLMSNVKSEMMFLQLLECFACIFEE